MGSQPTPITSSARVVDNTSPKLASGQQQQQMRSDVQPGSASGTRSDVPTIGPSGRTDPQAKSDIAIVNLMSQTGPIQVPVRRAADTFTSDDYLRQNNNGGDPTRTPQNSGAISPPQERIPPVVLAQVNSTIDRVNTVITPGDKSQNSPTVDTSTPTVIRGAQLVPGVLDGSTRTSNPAANDSARILPSDGRTVSPGGGTQDSASRTPSNAGLDGSLNVPRVDSATKPADLSRSVGTDPGGVRPSDSARNANADNSGRPGGRGMPSELR